MTVDYSDRAITMRLKRVAQLRRVCLSLANAKPLDSPQTRTPAESRGRPDESK
jgi:hypothetical protein